MTDEIAVRLSFFFAVLIIVSVWEYISPRRILRNSKIKRWLSNLGVTLINSFLIRLWFPAAAVGMAVTAKAHGWGLLNNLSAPYWIRVICGLIVLDLIIYLQHVMFHAVPALWRIHMMHHADLDFDVTTALRFHPIEIMISMLIKLAAVAALGPPAGAVLIFEIFLNAAAMFNHGNIRLYPGIDKFLRLIIVTPDMHRVHHSVVINETNSNFGFNLPWWDRLMGTYRDQPFNDHDNMSIGLSHIRDFSRSIFLRMLLIPFLESPGSYSIARQDKKARVKE